VLEPLQALAKADGMPEPRPGAYQRDKAVQLLLDHYATGWTQAELVAIYGAIPGSTWWLKMKASGSRPGASWMSPEVLRRYEGASSGQNATTAALELARRQVQNDKLQAVARVTAEVEHTHSLLTDQDDRWAAELSQLPERRQPRRLQ
jgi:hypothetical protein